MRISALRVPMLAALTAASLAGCYSLSRSDGGGQTTFGGTRLINAADIAVPAGYRIEAVAQGLNFPTGITFDEQGQPYVVESGYSYGEVFTTPRLIRLHKDGSQTTIASGERNGPWTGVTYANGMFYVAEGGQLEGGRILRVTKDGKIAALISGLPGMGDHHTNGPVVGPDGALYFGQGTATNSGVVGEDNAKFGWLRRFPQFHDTPCQDIVLSGQNFPSRNPLKPGSSEHVLTGAFSPFGTSVSAGQTVRGSVPCSGAVLRLPPSGGKPELVAWGFRNPFGLAFSPDGKLYVSDNGYDDRGSRPVWGTPDVVWEVRPGTWYGWPDFSAGRPLTNEDFHPPGKTRPLPQLASYPNRPPKPVLELGVHASVNGFDFSRNPAFGHVGEAFIAVFGDQAPDTGKVMHPVGFKVLRADMRTGEVQDFAVNRGPSNGPASKLKNGGLERPVAARFDPSGQALYVVDFGVMLVDKKGPKPQLGTGVVWRITRGGPR